jgi:hypothetical protein
MSLSAYVALVRSVRAQLKSSGVNVVVAAVGRHERARKDNQAPGGAGRIVFFEPKNGDRGILTRGHRAAAANPRVLFERQRPFTISVWAAGTDPRDEESNIEALDALHDLLWQAITRAEWDGRPLGVEQVGNLREEDPNTESFFGKELLIDCVVKEAVFDREHGTAFATPAVTRVEE